MPWGASSPQALRCPPPRSGPSRAAMTATAANGPGGKEGAANGPGGKEGGGGCCWAEAVVSLDRASADEHPARDPAPAAACGGGLGSGWMRRDLTARVSAPARSSAAVMGGQGGSAAPPLSDASPRSPGAVRIGRRSGSAPTGATGRRMLAWYARARSWRGPAAAEAMRSASGGALSARKAALPLSGLQRPGERVAARERAAGACKGPNDCLVPPPVA
jgi:hypothetical protein